MVCLFPKDATDFSTNGMKVLQPVACTVKETLNDDYSLSITMPMWDTSISEGMILRAPTPNGNQLFRVYESDVDALGQNAYSARHIFYDLLDSFIEDTQPTGNGQTAISAILAGTSFTGLSDITASNSAEYQMMNPVKALLGGNDSDGNAFINRWGGEIERDNFTVRMPSRLGMDRGVAIRYRKNLTGLTIKTDLSNVVTRIYPTGRQSDGQTILTIPEKYVDSPIIGSYAHPKIARCDYDKIQVVDKTDDSHPTLVTIDQAYGLLRSAAAADFASGIDKPTVSAEVEFIPLETTEEYKNDGLAGLEKVYLGDTVHIYHEPLGIALTARVVSYEYDGLTQRYNKIMLGSVQESVGTARSTVGKIASGAQQTADDAKSGVAKAEIKIGDLEISIKGKVSFSDLSGDGTTVINGANITTGRISAENGSWWLDLKTGDFYLSGGTFAGLIKWLKSSGATGGQIFYTEDGGLRIESNSITLDGNVEVPSGAHLSTADLNGVDMRNAITGNWVFKMADGSEHRLYFDHGILINAN